MRKRSRAQDRLLLSLLFEGGKEPYYEMQGKVIQDYTQYDKNIENLNLTENMRIALERRMNGLSYPEIGRILDRAQSTAFEYFIEMRQRYTAIYG